VINAALCVAIMAHAYGRSRDLLDFRAGFFLATFLFVALPGLIIDLELTPITAFWRSDTIRALMIGRPEFVLAQFLVLIGVLAVGVPVLLDRPPRGAAPRERDPAAMATPRGTPSTAIRVSRRIWLLYGGSLAGLTALAFVQYGGLLEIIIYSVTPDVRLASDRVRLAGLANLFLFAGAISAYYAAARCSGRALRISLFLPVILLVLPAGNRGSLLTVLVIGAAATFDLQPRRPLLHALGVCLLLPPVASALVRLRMLAVFQHFGDYSLLDMYRDFTAESLMLPTFAFALNGLRKGVIEFAYGADLILFPLWYVPRVFWPGKPLPLDFRLSEALGLHDGDLFGTPVSIFGGFYVNFTPWAYLPALALFGCLLAFLYRRFRDDRLLKVVLLTFVIDIVRVGDIARELLTLSFALIMIALVRALAVRPRAAADRNAASREVRFPVHSEAT
jgi:hypothetical protein